MVGDPTVSAASLTLSSIMKIFGKYQAYQSLKIKETDKGLREEISRRISMIINHINTLEARALESKDAQKITAIVRVRSDLADFTKDIQYGPTGATDRASSSEILQKNQIKSLLEHDLEVLKRLVEATHMVNQILDSNVKNDGEGITNILELEQKIVGVRNRFNDRLSFLSKL